jgi:hypothetical protein
MKKKLLILLLSFPAVCMAQTTPVKYDTVSVWIGANQYPLNSVVANWNDADSSVSFSRLSGPVAEVSTKYYKYTLNGTPFASLSALKTWVKNFFRNNSIL